MYRAKNDIGVFRVQIRQILAEDEDELQTIELGNRPLFAQMDVLVHFAGNVVGWKQVARSARFLEIWQLF